MSLRDSSRNGFSSRSHLTTSASGFDLSATNIRRRTVSAGRPYDVDSSTSGSSFPSATTSAQVTTPRA